MSFANNIQYSNILFTSIININVQSNNMSSCNVMLYGKTKNNALHKVWSEH